MASAHAAGRTSEQVAITMDWLPTLLAAAGAAPDPAFPPDGINLLPLITQTASPVERTLFWRYKANAQRAVRDGDYKFLKILDNTFLFNVVDDPMERANLKERQKDVYDRLVAEWLAWNATMLPEIDESSTDNFTGGQLADHIGTPAVERQGRQPGASLAPHIHELGAQTTGSPSALCACRSCPGSVGSRHVIGQMRDTASQPARLDVAHLHGAHRAPRTTRPPPGEVRRGAFATRPPTRQSCASSPSNPCPATAATSRPPSG